MGDKVTIDQDHCWLYWINTHAVLQLSLTVEFLEALYNQFVVTRHFVSNCIHTANTSLKHLQIQHTIHPMFIVRGTLRHLYKSDYDCLRTLGPCLRINLTISSSILLRKDPSGWAIKGTTFSKIRVMYTTTMTSFSLWNKQERRHSSVVCE